MTVRELREKYLRFFESKGHSRFLSGSLIPYDVTGRLDESLLFNGAGMIQFKPYFRGVAEPQNRRLTTCQKCVRTGDIDEVGDTSHLTFFEMLGNFSFGDYFRTEAIAFSWEFLTSHEWLGLNPKRLAFTIFATDDEAYAEWARHISAAGMDPATRIFRLGEETNYWPAGAFSNGPPGPCGPNSEMFYWTSSDAPPEGSYSRDDYLRDEAEGKWLEIWNDVFIQYEWQGEPNADGKGHRKTGMPELPFRSIDTGMGLDRTAAVLGGRASVYDTDVFQPILQRIVDLSASGIRYSDLPPAEQVAARIIADHMRTASFCIADGILPSNTGRGYVLRRLIRRAVLKGQRALGIADAFLYKVYVGVVESMGDAYPELLERRAVIVETLRNEEELFRRTLLGGEGILREALETSDRVLSGAVAFRLYDTFGFPLEVTKELAAEAGFEVDLDGYESALKEAQERSRGAQEREAVYGGVEGNPFSDLNPTVFLGYDVLESDCEVVRADGNLLVLNQTPFYADSGGQTADTGALIVGGSRLPVEAVTKQGGVFVHRLATRPDLTPGDVVKAVVSPERRAQIKRNHTATHLLHAALRQVLGTHVSQAGSYVGPDRLRFDFTHGKAMTETEKSDVERIVNEQALANTPVVTYVDLPIDEAKAKGAMALFGEKYGDKVRMVEIGEFSRELCGGTHVRTSAEVGLFKIIGEASAASGVRRIEAVTGEGAYAWMLEEHAKLHEVAEVLKATPSTVVEAAQRTLEQLRDERRKREKAEIAGLRGGAEAGATVTELGPVALWTRNFGEVDPKLAAQELDSAVAQRPNLVAVSAVLSDGKVQFACKCGPAAVAAGAHAGNLLREVAKVAGGGGGGRPDFATAGGRDPSKADLALEAAHSALQSMVG
jgi:alanyl-tRNA synthetase